MFFTSGFYVNSAIDPYLYQPAFAKIDARIAVGPMDRRWELAIVGRNLNDRYTGTYRATMGGRLAPLKCCPMRLGRSGCSSPSNTDATPGVFQSARPARVNWQVLRLWSTV